MIRRQRERLEAALVRGIRSLRIWPDHDAGVLVKRSDCLCYEPLGKDRIMSPQRIDDAAMPLNALNPLALLSAHRVDDDEREERDDDSPESLHEHAVSRHLRHQQVKVQVALVECTNILADGCGAHIGERLFEFAQINFLLGYNPRAITF